MKIVQWTLAVVGALALAVVAIGFFLPSAFLVSRSVVINAPPRKVYDLVVEPRQWARWSEWNRRDPAMKITYKGPPFGMGSRWEWVSKSEGAGSMEFTHVEPDRAVEYALTFADFNMRSAGAIRLEPQGSATRVTWTSSGDVGGNPVKHYLAAMMDRLTGPDFEAGLANLKALAESP
jgi:uncharacterized protein YndB with AHSA1/START domain